MLATLTDVIPIAPGWLYQVKHDGFRMQGHRTGQDARLYSRNGLVWTDQLPRIAAGLLSLPCCSCVLDGEAVVQLPNGRDDFHSLRSRSGAGRAVLMAFDLLELDGQDLRSWPLVERRAELAHLLASPIDGIAFVDAHDAYGPELFRHACAMGLEGIICKRKDAPNRSGPSPAWLKARCPDYRRP
ncbi:hypothetical protein GCM10007036_31200 [Alsobacter metallidurans]|uniref:ATP-dependent DNA ligase family profile domain-containing protein n=2 Tax=Alsobacter metallidurans TaxID=340221 RepID=A0A917I9G8_9HYPH|nr:hypothetical protein GCM10007036_31200 [Alsobacter metallidurans]